jgi:hypothetical protein
VGVLHDRHGQGHRLSDEERAVYARFTRMESSLMRFLHRFKDNLVEGRANQWRCRAGARYLYICEDGLVHYCSQQRGAPGIPLELYTSEDLRREFRTEKACAPLCTLSCVHTVAALDNWRVPQSVPTPVRQPQPGT